MPVPKLIDVTPFEPLIIKAHYDGFDFKKCQTQLQGNPSNYYLESIFSKINKISDYSYKNFYSEKSHGFNKIEYKEDLLIDGYFQSEKYFMDFKTEVIELFNISDYDKKLVAELLPVKKNITSVHVRRGDYLNYPDIHPTCTLDYYKNAMNKLLTDKKYYQRLRTNALACRKKYCWQEEEKKLIAFYKNLLG
jgi:hypothetical protein